MNFQAISNPTDDSQKKALQAVLPLVAKLKKFFEFSTELGILFENLQCESIYPSP
jgi:CYRIA/CYRIB Rac1 binding domain